MHTFIRSVALSFIYFYSATLAHSALATDIRLNSLGYLPKQEKRATIVVPCTEFSVVSVPDQAVVYQGKIAEPFLNRDTNETVYIADFSAVTEPGEYLLRVEGAGDSVAFNIAEDIYNFPYLTAMKGMYLWRCGTAVSGEHNGIEYSHAACHLDDAYLDYVGQPGEIKSGLKGWHDAGDYNKYTVNAGVTVGALFRAWEQFPRIRKMALALPDEERNNSLPDFLDEMKFEIEWLLTMQSPDGSVYHKLSARNFSGFIMPERHTTRRYFTPWGSAATADFVAMTAMAGRIFQPYDEDFAQQCRDAALMSYEFLAANPANHSPDLSGFSTGGYNTQDPDDRLWAAAEMWETFGDEKYLQDFEDRAQKMDRLFVTNWDWSEVRNLGMFTYLLSSREGRDSNFYDRARRALISTSDSIVTTRKQHGYERPLGSSYYWGCNGTVARQCMNLLIAHELSPNPEYVETALAALGHLFGRNVYGRSYVTGLGIDPPMNPHDRRSGADGIRAPWPGYLVGGGHSATGWRDVQADYETNEIAINWNGALIYALAAFVASEEQTGVESLEY